VVGPRPRRSDYVVPGLGGRRIFRQAAYEDAVGSWARRRDEEREQQQVNRSTWTPAGSQNPDAGVIEGTDHVVSFKTGGPNGDETLIADGDYSDDKAGFNGPRGSPSHDHYGSAREGGWIDKVRGFFTDPTD